MSSQSVPRNNSAGLPARNSVEDLKEALAYLTDEERAQFEALLGGHTPLWSPFPGPQVMALESPADEVFFGGAAGGGKTDLLLGLALTQHKNSLIFRREYPQLRSLVQRSMGLLQPPRHGTYNSQSFLWRLKDGRTVEFGAVQHPQDVTRYQGRPHDGLFFDELTHFLREQYLFLLGWNRPADGNPNQRCRVVCTGNPPTTPEGRWVVKEWAPWLEKGFPDPAEPGELRWYAREADSELVWLKTPGSYRLKNGDHVSPRSRTFFPSRVDHNPLLMKAGYKTVLQGLPEPLRSQMLYGDFGVGGEDDPWQVVPTLWVQKSMDAWTSDGASLPQTCIGCDVARGGKDKTAVAALHGTWVAPLWCYPGKSQTDGRSTAAQVRQHATGPDVPVRVDAIGVGAAVYDALREQGGAVQGFVGSNKCDFRDRSRKLGFVNMRSYGWWSLRELLDPSWGVGLLLPKDADLLADLCAPRWRMTPRGIQVEAKEDTMKRIGRSPDRADAVILACLPFFQNHYPSQVEVAKPRALYDTDRPSSARKRGWLGLRRRD